MRALVILTVFLLLTVVYGGLLNGKLFKREAQRCFLTNQEYRDCGPTCPTTCESLLKTKEDVFCPELCVPGCFCRQGFVLNRWGNCIPLEKCPCHGPDEVFQCSTDCKETCASRNDACDYDNTHCINKCVCRSGYVRDKSGNCIPASECSN